MSARRRISKAQLRPVGDVGLPGGGQRLGQRGDPLIRGTLQCLPLGAGIGAGLIEISTKICQHLPFGGRLGPQGCEFPTCGGGLGSLLPCVGTRGCELFSSGCSGLFRLGAYLLQVSGQLLTDLGGLGDGGFGCGVGFRAESFGFSDTLFGSPAGTLRIGDLLLGGGDFRQGIAVRIGDLSPGGLNVTSDPNVGQQRGQELLQTLDPIGQLLQMLLQPGPGQ